MQQHTKQIINNLLGEIGAMEKATAEIHNCNQMQIACQPRMIMEPVDA